MKTRKAERTRKKIIDIFYRLNDNPSEPLCTVAQICAEMDISVSTFYCHFSGIAELIDEEGCRLQEEMQELNDRLMDPSVQNKEPFIMTREKMLSIIRLAQLRRRENLLLLRPDLMHPFREYIRKMIKAGVSSALETLPVPKKDYIVGFMTAGIMDAMIRWLEEQNMSAEEFVDVLFGVESAIIRSALDR